MNRTDDVFEYDRGCKQFFCRFCGNNYSLHKHKEDCPVTSEARYRSKQQKKQFYNSAEWKALRLKALERDNYECQECKRLGKVHVDSVKVEGQRKSIELNVHHIKEIEYHPELALSLNNLETLCLDHHNEKHPEKGFTPQEPKWNDERW